MVGQILMEKATRGSIRYVRSLVERACSSEEWDHSTNKASETVRPVSKIRIDSKERRTARRIDVR